MPDQPKLRLAGPTRPLGAPEIPQFHLPAAKPEGKAVYAPRLYGSANILFADKKRGVNEGRTVTVLVPIEAGARTIDWDAAKPTDIPRARLLSDPAVKAPYLPLPAAGMQVNTFTRWAKQFDRWLARTQRVTATEGTEPIQIAPKRGGVTVELVAIVWELTSN